MDGAVMGIQDMVAPIEKGPLYSLEFWEITPLVAMAFALAFLGIYSASQHSWLAFGVLALIQLASASAGGLLGFLFGVPRYRSSPESKSGFDFNTNLEQISDWLTKIIIGATLVQIREIVDGLGTVSLVIGNQISTQSAAAVACSAIVFSLFCGFIWGYLWISIRVRKRIDLPAAARQISENTPEGAPLK